MTDLQTTATATVTVTITVTIDGETKTFTADATTDSNPYRIARGLVEGTKSDAWHWLSYRSVEQ